MASAKVAGFLVFFFILDLLRPVDFQRGPRDRDEQREADKDDKCNHVRFLFRVLVFGTVIGMMIRSMCK